ncbi:MAG: YdcH family protein [Acidobacteriia bacterium]|nr:YdcH family protein [Terriglobia bacterium]
MAEATATEVIKERLMRDSADFRRLAQIHTRYSEALEKLVHKGYLTEQEKVEEVNLKKMKLQLKDQMELLIQKHRQPTNAN